MLKAAVYPTTVGTALLLDNPWCRVWDFSLAPGEENETHQHVMDYAFLYVGAPPPGLTLHPGLS